MARAESLTSHAARRGPLTSGGRRVPREEAHLGPPGSRPSALIVVQNLPVPIDRRVWQEAGTLKAAGFAVTVICPKGGQYRKASERIDGIDIRRFGLPLEGRSTVGLLVEYALTALLIFTMVTREALRRRPDVVQICNPPDFLIFLVLHLKLFFGSKIIFDHHDLCPELYEVKFGKRGFFYSVLVFCERMTFRLADVVIANNASFKAVARERGKVPADRLWTVHSYMKQPAAAAPEADAVGPKDPAGKLTVGYLGVIGSQDGVDTFIEAAAILLRGREAERVDIVVVGDGPELLAVRGLALKLGIADRVRFTGFLTGAALQGELRRFDIAVAPDPPNALNTRLSMNKVFEYMSVGAPMVHLGLEQAGGDAGPCGVKAETPDAAGLAAAIEGLIRDPALRARMRKEAPVRALGFTWESQEPALLGAYAQAMGEEGAGRPARRRPRRAAAAASAEE